MKGEGEEKRNKTKDSGQLGEKGGGERRKKGRGGSHGVDFKETKYDKGKCDTRDNRGVSVVFVEVAKEGNIIGREEEKERSKGKDGKRGRGRGGGRGGGRSGEPVGMDIAGSGKGEENKSVASRG